MAFKHQIELFGTALQAWDDVRPSPERDRASDFAKRAMERAERAGARVLVCGESDYPNRLLALRRAR